MRSTLIQQARDVAEELRDLTAPEYIDGKPSCSSRDALLLEAAEVLEELANMVEK